MGYKGSEESRCTVGSKEAFYKAYRLITRPGSDKLLNWLESTDFFRAPASTRFHLACEGGLCEHSVHVYNRLRELFLAEVANFRELTPEEEETVAICGLLHDICKVNVYGTEMKNQKTYDAAKVAAAESWQVKHDAQGDFIWESVPRYIFDDRHPYGHGERSVYIISGFMKLSRE